MKIVEFPNYNLYNIPEALRKLANEIEEVPERAVHLVAVFDTADGSANYRCFGKDFTGAYAVGLLEYGKLIVMGVKDE